MNRRMRRLAPWVLSILILSACNLFSQQPAITVPTESPAGGQTAIPEVTQLGGLSWPMKDMTSRPQIWFGPLDPPAWSQANPGGGAYDFFDLFNAEAPWARSSEAVRVMLLYPTWLSGTASRTQLQRVFEDLKRRRIAIAFEAGPLTERGSCNAATLEGFSGAAPARTIAQNIRSAGGVLYSMSLEHGFDAATYYDAACRMTPTEIAQDVSNTIAAVRQVFPDVVVGSIETANLDVNDVAAWLEAYRQVTGEELGYFHLDVNFHMPDWAERAKAIEDAVQSRGIDFGIYYLGNPDDTTDEEWLAHAEERFVDFEVIHAGHPDQPMFQSWDAHPSALLPEEQPGTFTHLITRYMRPRPALTLELSPQTASGLLTTVDGSPLADAPIEISMTPISGEGTFADYTLSGVVPDGVTHADVGLRINTECDCAGPAQLVFASADYLEDGRAGNRVPNGDFSDGLQGWGSWGAGSSQLGQGENGLGRALLIEATTRQDVGLNSDSFEVTPGKGFSLTLRARVDPLTNGSGYFDIVFLSDTGEAGRITIPIQVASMVLGSTSTGDDGSYAFELRGLPAGTLMVRAWFDGNDNVWPATAEQEFNP